MDLYAFVATTQTGIGFSDGHRHVMSALHDAGVDPIRTWTEDEKAFVLVENAPSELPHRVARDASVTVTGTYALDAAEVRGVSRTAWDALPGDVQTLSARLAGATAVQGRMPVYPCCGGIGIHAQGCTYGG